MQQLKKWQKLKSGDIVDVIAPGYATSPETLAVAEKFLRDQGFIPRFPKDLLSPTHFHSNTDALRFAHLKKALLAKDSAAIWCLRGGYGSNRLVPWLAKLKAPAKSKIFIGISDVTSLHVFLNQKWKWCTLHAALLDRISSPRMPKALMDETLQVLKGEITEIHFENLRSMNKKADTLKNLQAPIVGGNLTTLQSSLGTPWSIQTKDRLLFLEDIGERGYRVDRMLEHFKQAGILKGCKGILLGHWLGGEEPEDKNSEHKSRVFEALERFAAENPALPMWSGIESGHDSNLRALPFGTQASLKRTKDGISLRVDSGSR
jgi:muramoyltetrapeptide carboxypeptidase